MWGGGGGRERERESERRKRDREVINNALLDNKGSQLS